jgi:hypothetical protein
MPDPEQRVLYGQFLYGKMEWRELPEGGGFVQVRGRRGSLQAATIVKSKSFVQFRGIYYVAAPMGEFLCLLTIMTALSSASLHKS